MYIVHTKKCIYDMGNTEELFAMKNLKLKSCCILEFKIMCNIIYYK